jgi:hypothetical protein
MMTRTFYEYPVTNPAVNLRKKSLSTPHGGCLEKSLIELRNLSQNLA